MSMIEKLDAFTRHPPSFINNVGQPCHMMCTHLCTVSSDSHYVTRSRNCIPGGVDKACWLPGENIKPLYNSCEY